MIQALTYVYLVFVLIFKTVFPFGLPPKAVPAADTGSLAAVDALGRKAVSAGDSAPYGRLNWIYGGGGKSVCKTLTDTLFR